MSGISRLAEIIKNVIKTEGPITFERFMDMALYYPEIGYYTSKREKIGPEGDFYTSPDVHPLFARLIARQVIEMWQILGEPAEWQFVEYGAGKGTLARRFLAELKVQCPGCFKALTYWIIEISPTFIKRQQKVLAELKLSEGKVCWAAGPEEVSGGSITGCIFSNELVDAFPVHRVRQEETGLKELYVNCRDGQFYVEEGVLSDPLLANYFLAQDIELRPGQTAEVNLQAIDWLNRQACCLKRGFLFTVDYGVTADLLYSEARFNGTLRCFYKHTLNDDPFRNIGEQDITSHVNFTALQLWGEKAGLSRAGLISQSDFLINMGILDTLKNQQEYRFNSKKLHDTLAIKQLIMPEGMGRYFRILIQYKGLGAEPVLQGLKRKRYF